jgi:superfamily II DNA or RNA helicase
MVGNIDDLVDRITRRSRSPGERFEEEFLSERPRSEWPSYIDETAVDVSVGIGIGDTNLDSIDFGREVGPYYARGLERVTGSHSDVTAVLDHVVSETELGKLAYRLNELAHELTQSDTGLRDVRHAIEVLIRKIATSETERTLDSFGAAGTAAVSDVVVEMLSDEIVAENAEAIVEEFGKSVGDGILARLDEPQMTTRLWEHQAEALDAWAEAGYRGYADMATATGKTVLALAAIALRYGNLHPVDETIDRGDPRPGADRAGKDRVLIVAHSDLILEQWRREFDTHLNVPEERTSGGDEVELTWGRIEFRTAQSLVNEDRNEYDLVILDEAHHYLTGGEWGALLDEFDGEVLALSGSVNDAGVDSERLQSRLENAVGPEVMRYSITDAQDDGVIPAFDWEVRYAPYATDDEFAEVSASTERAFTEFRARVERGELDLGDGLRTYEDVRRFSHTTEGRELKERDGEFRDLATALFSRRTRRWNASPTLGSVVEVALEHPNDHVIVLADSNAQVNELGDRLREHGVHDEVVVATRDVGRSRLRDRLDAFDAAEGGGVLVGTGDLIGEGVDIPNAAVGINMATGGVNAELVQRIGRVLRNPTGDKHAQFYNVVGVPDGDEAVPREDGLRLLEDAAEFCGLGARFDNLPGFATASDVDGEPLAEQLTSGCSFVRELDEAGHYEFPDDPAERKHLQELLTTLESTGDGRIDATLGAWSQYTWIDGPPSRQLEVVVHDESGTPVTDAVVTIEGESTREQRVGDEGRARFDVDRGTREVTVRVVTESDRFEDAEKVVELERGSDTEYGIELPVVASSENVPVPPGEDEVVVRAIREVARAVGGAPKTMEFQHRGEISLNRVLESYERWSEALEAAGVADGPPPTPPGSNGDDETEAQGESEGAGPDTSESDPPPGTDTSPAPNALAEWYESFGELADVVETLRSVEDFGTEDQRAILQTWSDEIESRHVGDDGLGARQAEENAFTMSEYRVAYGDGDRVTDYQAIETTELPEVVRAVLVPRDEIPLDRSFYLPVAPKSETPVPVVVLTETELETARERLDEIEGDVPRPEEGGDSSTAETTGRGESSDTASDGEPSLQAPSEHEGPDEREATAPGDSGFEFGAVDESGNDESESFSAAVRRVAEGFDRPIRPTDLASNSDYGRHSRLEEHSHWDEAVAAAGVDREESLLEELDRIVHETGSDPTRGAVDEHGRVGISSFTNCFGSWAAALERYREWSRDSTGTTTASEDSVTTSSGDVVDSSSGPDSRSVEPLLQGIREIDEKLDRPLRRTDLVTHTEFERDAYEGAYDSWADAIEAAGVDRERNFLAELDRIARKVGRVPTVSDVNDHARVSAGMFVQHFGTWSAAIDAYRDAHGRLGGDGSS